MSETPDAPLSSLRRASPSPLVQTSGPFSSWVKKAAGRLGRGPFSRTAKKKDEVDDLLNSDAFLLKKVEILRKQIKKTEGEIEEANLAAAAEWKEWGPQVSGLTWESLREGGITRVRL